MVGGFGIEAGEIEKIAKQCVDVNELLRIERARAFAKALDERRRFRVGAQKPVREDGDSARLRVVMDLGVTVIQLFDCAVDEAVRCL